MTVWKLILHHTNERRQKMLDWSRDEGRIALGWGEVGDVSRYSSYEEMQKKATQQYDLKQHPGAAICLWKFCKVMKPGDLVILVGEGSQRELVMEVTGGYEWKPTREADTFDDYQHQRKAHIYNGETADALWTNTDAKTRRSHLPLVSLYIR